jgi:hypothetical protein
MKKNTAKTTLFALIAAVLVAVPFAGLAGDSTNTPTATAPAPKKHSVPFHGKVAAVDSAAAMTFTVGTMTIAVTSDTKITKDGQPAVFADITPGATVRGSYKKDATGKLTAVSVRIGEKKKQAAPAAQ